MPVEQRGQVIAVEPGPTGSYREEPRRFNGRRQPSCGGTSRMMREYQVRFCERLGVKFPGPTRQNPKLPHRNSNGRFTSISGHNVAAVFLTDAWVMRQGPTAWVIGSH